jgi:S-formylglutathione hydrolase FrmB
MLRAALALAAAAATTLALGAWRSAGDPLPPGVIGEDSYASAALQGRLPFAVYLPPGYSTDTKTRYPVIYFLHGLPAAPYTFRGIGYVAQALEHTGQRAIIVAPLGARDGDTDPEYLDWGPGRNWETAVALELPAYDDANYRTIPTRRGRALVGVSAGGYGAVLLGIHHLDSFAVVESWSGYFHPTNPAGTTALELGSTDADARASAHTFVRLLSVAFRERSTFFAFYVGRGDARFRAENEVLDTELAAAHVPHVFELYPGAHQATVWRAHASQWLGLALSHLAPAR